MAANIKTREVVKGTIKTLDKSQITAARMKQSYMKTKERADSATHADDSSPSEYAVNSASVKSETLMRETGHKASIVGKRSAEVTKKNLIRTREKVMQRRTSAVIKLANTVKWKVNRKPLPQNA